MNSAAAAKSLQSCPTLCNPIDGNPPGSPVPGILQARTLEWGAISFTNAGKWKVKVKSLSRVWLFETPWTAAYQAPPSMGFSRQEYWSGVPLPSPNTEEKLSDLDLVVLSTMKLSSSVNNWLYIPFLFLSWRMCIKRCVSVHSFYSLALIPHLPHKRSGYIAYIYYLFGDFHTLYLKKYYFLIFLSFFLFLFFFFWNLPSSLTIYPSICQSVFRV